MGEKLNKAILPDKYDNYVFDLYGTLVDIHTDEEPKEIWDKLALFYGYYGACYSAEELKKRYETLVKGKEADLKVSLENDPHYAHESSPEIEITDVFQSLFMEKGVEADNTLAIHAGQFFRVLATEYIRVYPGTIEMLQNLKKKGKNVYLLSNAQRIFTAYEMQVIQIAKYFDDTECWGRTRTCKGESNKILIKRNNLCNPVYAGDTSGDAESADYAGIPFIYAAYGFGNVSSDKYIAKIDDIKNLPELMEEL